MCEAAHPWTRGDIRGACPQLRRATCSPAGDQCDDGRPGGWGPRKGTGNVGGLRKQPFGPRLLWPAPPAPLRDRWLRPRPPGRPFSPCPPGRQPLRGPLRGRYAVTARLPGRFWLPIGGRGRCGSLRSLGRSWKGAPGAPGGVPAQRGGARGSWDAFRAVRGGVRGHQGVVDGGHPIPMDSRPGSRPAACHGLPRRLRRPGGLTGRWSIS